MRIECCEKNEKSNDSIGKKLLALPPYDHTIFMTMTNGYEGYIADE